VARVLTLIAVVVVATLAGCGSSSKPTADRGRVIFRNGTSGNLSCAFCHTFRSAGAVGPFGPDLDNIITDEFRNHGLSGQKIQQFVLDTLAHPPCVDAKDPSRCMPRDLAHGSDAKSVAMFVAKCAGIAGRTGTPHTPGCRPTDGLPPLHGLAAKGARLYSKHGCISCHTMNGNGLVAPSFKGLAGSQVKLADGTTTTATDAYLITSILAPDAQIVKGYRRGVMSLRFPPGSVPIAQAKALVAFIKALH
jgi:cytochrome c551/c552